MPATETSIGLNTYHTTAKITDALGAVFQNTLVASSPSYTVRGIDKEWGRRNGNKIGNSYQRRLPQAFRGYAGRTFVSEPIESFEFNIVIDNQRGIGYDYNMWEKKFLMAPEQAHIMKPAVADLLSPLDISATKGFVSGADDAPMGASRSGYSSSLDNEAMGSSKGTPPSDGHSQSIHAFGRAGTTMAKEAGTNILAAIDVFADAGARMEAEALNENLVAFLPPDMNKQAAISFADQFNPQQVISKMYRRAAIVGTDMPALGIDVYERTQSLHQHEVGNVQGGAATGIRVYAAPAQGAEEIALKGFPSGRTDDGLKRGDILGFQTGTGATATRVRAVNPRTRQPVASDFNVVVLEDASKTSGSVITAKVFPHITSQGPTGGPASGLAAYRNRTCARQPAVDDYIVLNGRPLTSNTEAAVIGGKTVETGYLATPQTVGFVMVGLDLPENEEKQYDIHIENELFLQVIKDFDFQDKQNRCRMDAVWGVRNLRKQLGGKFFGQVLD